MHNISTTDPSCHLIGLFSSSHGYMTKVFTEDDEGCLHKKTQGNMGSGRYETRSVCRPSEFAELISGLSREQALTYGVYMHQGQAVESARVTTSDKFKAEDYPRKVARLDGLMQWPDNGVMMFDFDGLPADTSFDSLVASLVSYIPEIAKAPMVVGDSAGGRIFKDGEYLPNKDNTSGFRVYVFVKDAAYIPIVKNWLRNTMRERGDVTLGRNKANARKETFLIDFTVYQPSRVDYASGAVVPTGYEQRRRLEVRNDDTPALDLTKLTIEGWGALVAAKKSYDSVLAMGDACPLFLEQHRKRYEAALKPFKVLGSKARDFIGAGEGEASRRLARIDDDLAEWIETMRGLPFVVAEGGQIDRRKYNDRLKAAINNASLLEQNSERVDRSGRFMVFLKACVHIGIRNPDELALILDSEDDKLGAFEKWREWKREGKAVRELHRGLRNAVDAIADEALEKAATVSSVTDTLPVWLSQYTPANSMEKAA